MLDMYSDLAESRLELYLDGLETNAVRRESAPNRNPFDLVVQLPLWVEHYPEEPWLS
jgi:hypothetical protein